MEVFDSLVAMAEVGSDVEEQSCQAEVEAEPSLLLALELPEVGRGPESHKWGIQSMQKKRAADEADGQHRRRTQLRRIEWRKGLMQNTDEHGAGEPEATANDDNVAERQRAGRRAEEQQPNPAQSSTA